MVHLKLVTEYTFLGAFGPLKKVMEAAKGDAVGIADFSTWGHVPFFKAAQKAGKKPILAVQLGVFPSLDRVRQTGKNMTFIARNNDGLRELYNLTTQAHRDFYYTPRTTEKAVNGLSENIIVLSGINPNLSTLQHPNLYLELNPGFGHWNRMALDCAKKFRLPLVVTDDMFYPRASDKKAYEVLAGDKAVRKTTPQHICSPAEIKLVIEGIPDSAFQNTYKIAEQCEVSLPKARMVHFTGMPSLRKLCEAGFKDRGIRKPTPEYKKRLDRELQLIEEKGFEDYFYLVSDMVNFAKKHMCVGPARGSAAGSLVCWLMGITEVDPLRFGLMFERFIDITRKDLPDIDLDFPDVKRDMVLNYLSEKYGKENVAHLGTISTYKPKSAITDVAKILNIPVYETTELKKAIIERSGGDARAAFCLMDTFESLDLGKDFLQKYPQMAIAQELEGHARHSGCHPAGMIVCDEPISNYCTVNDGIAQIDKQDAESLDMLKIDALGLRTLSVIEECLKLIKKDWRWLYAQELEDQKVFNIFNTQRFAGIFQFEGYAVQTLCKQMGINEFNDIVALTALARPGPLHCGGASAFIERRTGKEKVTYLHKKMKPFVEETFGIVVYQEQVMSIAREVGQMTWDDVTVLRKAMSKSMGDEFFSKYWDKFKEGAIKNGLKEAEAEAIWKNFMTFGSWAFNKSHAVSYGLVSFHCALLKAYFPLEYAAACLINAKDDDSSIKLLRELVREGYKYKPFDKALSEVDWSIKEGMLIGGLTSIRGIGEKKAKEIVLRRKLGEAMTPAIQKMLDAPVTPWDDIFEGDRRFGDYYVNPDKYNLKSMPPYCIKDIQEDGEYLFLGKIKEKNLRDLNEYQSVQKRGGKIIEKNNLFLNMVVEDDTDSIIVTIDRWNYEKLGKPIVEGAQLGDWYVWKGKVQGGWRKVKIERIRRIEDNG